MKTLDAWLTRVGVAITKVVGTMWCAIAFAALACVSLPAVLSTGNPTIIVAWVAQTFLQLVLLSIIMVGQAAQADGLHDHLHEQGQAAAEHHRKLAEIHAHLLGGD